ncbi:L7Ae/L30e/S12e/Gadd45 family ribosomal protein [Parablautia intestinalis]|uniref:L7Ae/L30e/S12e/Gadd45 family ribosomal protein n=1 Tax=Parablautia intestinalis TaxID=2320100 RepID=UPI0023BEF652|nr:ribosomal L7Ae/L30e/S12e/Gadd45 family protein [Parablautia intestinalis]MCI8615673.1 50S ribosomal protein L7ae [Lachnospiraceae bacterium]MDE7048168.1 ribosomal L7Ae/L30e/S12e/Gadd45 family protein [Lachnospiraceae bacterium]
MKSDRILSLLGLSARSRNLVSGEFSTEKAVKAGKAELVIVSSDASDNTKKLFSDKCRFYGIPFYLYGTKAELGRAIGKEIRSSVAVMDKGLAETIIKRLENS